MLNDRVIDDTKFVVAMEDQNWLRSRDINNGDKQLSKCGLVDFVMIRHGIYIGGFSVGIRG